jgi:hypothetical protein
VSEVMLNKYFEQKEDEKGNNNGTLLKTWSKSTVSLVDEIKRLSETVEILKEVPIT